MYLLIAFSIVYSLYTFCVCVFLLHFSHTSFFTHSHVYLHIEFPMCIFYFYLSYISFYCAFFMCIFMFPTCILLLHHHLYQSIMFLSETPYSHCFSQLSCLMSTGLEHPNVGGLFSAMSSPQKITFKNDFFIYFFFSFSSVKLIALSQQPSRAYFRVVLI